MRRTKFVCTIGPAISYAAQVVIEGAWGVASDHSSDGCAR